MKRFSKQLLSAAIVATMAVPAVVQATNGYFLIGFGTKSRGMAGVGVAEGVDGLATSNNPATMADVGTRFDIGADFFSAPIAVTHSDGTLSETTILEESDFEDTGFSYDNIFLIPHMGGTYEYSDEVTLGFAFIGAGMGTQYNQTLPEGNSSYFFNFNGLGGDDKVGIKLMQIQIPLSIAYKVNKKHTVGGGIVFGAQLFEAWGLKAFTELDFGSSQENLSNMGTDLSYGVGFKLGWQGRFIDDDLVVGVNYSSRVFMTEFDKYSSLFAEQGDFDIPENYAIGFAYNGFSSTSIKFDVQQINYSDVASVGNPGPYAGDRTEFNPLCPGEDTAACKLGGNQGMGFGWSDMTVYKLAAEFAVTDNWTLRGGFNYSKAPISGDQILFNMLAPATSEKHLTIGGTYEIDEEYEVSFSYVHAFENTIEGQTLFQPEGSNPDVTTTNAAISMKQRSFGVSLGVKW